MPFQDSQYGAGGAPPGFPAYLFGGYGAGPVGFSSPFGAPQPGRRPMAMPGWGDFSGGRTGGSLSGGAYGANAAPPYGGASSGGVGAGGVAGWGERAPGQPYSWADLSYPSNPQWLGGYLRDYANKLGYFGDPRNSMLMEFARQQAGRTSGALQQRINTASSMYGLDPAQAATYRLNAMLGGQGQEADYINQLLGQQFQSQQDWARQLAQQFAQIQDPRAARNAANQAAGYQTAGQLGGAGLAALPFLVP